MNAIENAIEIYNKELAGVWQCDEDELRGRLQKVCEYCESAGMGEQDAGAVCLIALCDYTMREFDEGKKILALLKILKQLKLGERLQIATAKGFLEELSCPTAGLEKDICEELKRLCIFAAADMSIEGINKRIDYEGRIMEVKAKKSRKATCDAGAHIFYAKQQLESGLIFGRSVSFQFEFKNKTAKYLLLGEVLNAMGTFERLGLQQLWDNQTTNKGRADTLMNWEAAFLKYQDRQEIAVNDLMRR